MRSDAIAQRKQIEFHRLQSTLSIYSDARPTSRERIKKNGVAQLRVLRRRFVAMVEWANWVTYCLPHHFVTIGQHPTSAADGHTIHCLNWKGQLVLDEGTTNPQTYTWIHKTALYDDEAYLHCDETFSTAVQLLRGFGDAALLCDYS